MVNHPNRSKSAKKPNPAAETQVTAYKGFDLGLKCRGFQYEIGKTYEFNGTPAACEQGFHACENPLDVLAYYAPGKSKYAIVTQSGALSRDADNTKIASAKITIDAEIHLHDIVAKAIAWIISHAKPTDVKHSEGYRSAASATGYQSAASATGEFSVATGAGFETRISGKLGSALFLVHRLNTYPADNHAEITHVWAGIAGCDGIKPDTFYQLDKDGQPVECP